MRESDIGNHFIKTEIDDLIGNRSYNRAETIINKTSLFCIFGMSLGETDKHIWSKILSRMIKESKSALIIFQYDEDHQINRYAFRRDMRTRSIKEHLLNYLPSDAENNYQDIKDRIFVVFNSNIFDVYETLNKKLQNVTN